jgi:bifunctional N-acetylglutamate synthase/kinase
MESTINAKKLGDRGAGQGAANVSSRLCQTGPSQFSKATVLAESGLMAPKDLIITKGWEGLDLAKVKGLLEISFGKKLSDAYFSDPAECVIVQADYKGIAIIKRIDGVAYLDKFAVDPEKRGNGVGRDIWGMMKDMHPTIMWRAHKQNPINGWYESHSDGSQETEKWKVFWCGGIGLEKIEKMVEKISAREPSFT